MPPKIAIIGYSFRLPNTNATQFWTDLLEGRNLVSEVDPQRWAIDTFLHPDKTHPGTSYTFTAGSVGDVSLFDAGFFGISPREAANMDPQQRLLLELAWETLENSGIQAASLRGSQCGVYIGISSVDYAYRLADDLAVIDSSVATGNTSSIAANRLSYFYDLRGPSMAIDTACSSSLVAFHQACRSILSGETSQALAGGVSLHLHPYGFLTFSKASMLSRKGCCNVFDASGDGYVRSEGGGLFFLKDYDQALEDGDRILAVVAASAVNTDGHKAGLTVPSAAGQISLLRQAYEQAGIDPADIDYVEAHGTGTAVGDPIEARALGAALGQQRSQGNPLPIGSIKSTIGHLEPAAGVAGLLKALFCIRHRIIPATAGITRLNPAIPFDDLNIEVVQENRPLKKTGRVVIGVNSFGFGGSNAHVVLESHQPGTSSGTGVGSSPDVPLPFLLSARSSEALKASARDLSEYLRVHPGMALYDIAYQSLFRRDWLEQRALLFGTSHAEIAGLLQGFADDTPVSGASLVMNSDLEAPSGPAFIYSGNGSQWFGMGKGLLNDPVFRETVREIDGLFSTYADWSLLDELAGLKGAERYQYTEIAQPALFAIQVGMTRMLRQRGIFPVAVAGHSVGEIAAAWACGALTLKDAVAVIYHRSRLQGTTKGDGQMTAVGLGVEAAGRLLRESGLDSSLTLAGVNSPKGVTIAGLPQFLTRMESVLSAKGIFNRRLDLDYAFHSPAMDVLESDIRKSLSSLTPVTGRVPFCSVVTGDILDGAGLDAEYWWLNIRRPVLFEQAIRRLLADGVNVFVEIGPAAILRGYLNDALQDAELPGRVITTGIRGDDDPQRIWEAAGQVILSGATVAWQALFPRKGSFVELPNYPWQRERHWHAVTAESCGLLQRHKIHPLLGYCLPQHELTWENQLDTLLFPFLADHQVGDAILFPGAGFAELALAAAHAWHQGDCLEIEELEIRSPLLLSENRSKSLRLGIAPHDGGFTVKAKDLASSDPWELHATGRILKDSHACVPGPRLSPLPVRTPDFTGHTHNLLTAAAGLGYGPGFQAIEQGWIDGSTALAVFRFPAATGIEKSGYQLHPALLDCTFQLIIQLLKELFPAFEGSVFVPVRIGRITLRSGGAIPHTARATLLRRAPHSLTADFILYDAGGDPIASIKEARFRAVRLRNSRAEIHPDFLEYHAVAAPHPDTLPVVAVAYEQLRHELAEARQRAAHKEVHRLYTDEVDPLLDALCSRFTLEAFQAIAGRRRLLTLEAIQELKAGNPSVSPFLDQLLFLAVDDGVVELSDVGYRVCDDDEEQASAQDIWNSLIQDYPDYFPIIHNVGRVGLQLKELLEGGLPQSKLPYRQISLPDLSRCVLGDGGRREIDLALQNLLIGALENLEEGRRLGIVEISDGLPLFAATVCQILDFSRSDYRLVTTNSGTVEEARQLLEQFPAIGVQQLDASAPEAELLLAGEQQQDLVIINDDFPTMQAACAALRRAWSLLAADGLLLLISRHPARWADFVFGADPLWWFPAASGASLSRQQPPPFWQQRLEQYGFGSVECLQFSPESTSGPCLLLARRVAAESAADQVPSAGSARLWLVIADEQGYPAKLAQQLADSLRNQGDRAILAPPGTATALTDLLREISASQGSVHGIVHLAGLHGLPMADDAAACLEMQVGRCTLATSLIQACEATQTAATCWLITAGAATHLLPARKTAGGNRSVASLADAALWGFGRTLMNETADDAIRLVDLENPDAIEIVAMALQKELEQVDGEQEIIITAAGGRFAPRLGLVPRPEPIAGKDHREAAPAIRLGFQFPGQLRNLRWEAHPDRAPAVDELEVEVRATGLNFRDFMYTLGLLSDEAVENGFAGPTLGMEFSGVVIAGGADVKGFRPGDQVVGFGPASFGNRVITKAGAVSHLPAGLSFEAATTIPAAFFTAYYALHHLARLQEGEKVLIHGAAGGVGIAAIQVAQWCGAEVYATAGTDEKRDFLRLLGVEQIFDSRSLAFADEILSRTGGAGIDVVLNSLSGEAINRNLRILKPFGRFLELGKRDFYENTPIGLRPFRNNISYFGIDADQLMGERPDLTATLFQQIMALFAEGLFHPLPYQTFEADQIVDAFRYMQQSRQIGKIVVTYRNGITNVQRIDKPVPARLELPEDATFLVTGGLSGFGLKSAEWLVEKGTRNLVLISRSGPVSEEARDVIAKLERGGVAIHAAACDVTDQAALSALLEEIAGSLPPLKGVLHAAMVIDDGLVRSMDQNQIRGVLAPKILGALHLHELTRAMALDYFILYSSGTTLFGNPGQGNYVAANTWLESLAAFRQAVGLPVTCIGWGAIDDVGFLARNTEIKEALTSRMGGAALNSAVALAALESLLLANCSGLGVLKLDWKALSRFLPRADTPKFSELARLSSDGAAREETGPDIQRLLADLSESEIQAMVAGMLKQEVGEVLRIAPEKIREDRLLHDMGLDSLMGVELAVALESRFGVKLPIMALSDSPTITKLAQRLVLQLRGAQDAPEAGSGQEILDQVRQVVSLHGAEVSSDAVEQFADDIQRGVVAPSERMIR